MDTNPDRAVKAAAAQRERVATLRDGYAKNPLRITSSASFDAEDLQDRVRTLLDSYECSATEEGWRSLALQLAIRHGEPGFEIQFEDKLTPSTRNRMEDEHLRWDDMIDAHVNPPAGSGVPRRTQREAAKLVAAVLEKEWKARGKTGQKPKKASYLETHFSGRKGRLSDDDPRNLPLYLLRHIHLSNLFRALMTAAERVRKPAYKKR